MDFTLGGEWDGWSHSHSAQPGSGLGLALPAWFECFEVDDGDDRIGGDAGSHLSGIASDTCEGSGQLIGASDGGGG